jgi:hypothetical protein
MTCAAGHQPNLYPYGGFFAKADAADVFVIVDNTQYVPKEYHNRNRIRLLGGQVVWLSVPVLHRGRFGQRIDEVEIDPTKPWAHDHRRTLELNYRRAPFFDRYFPEFADLLDRDWHRLVDYNLAVIRLALGCLGIATPVHLASALGVAGKASGLIVDLCQKVGADTYLHGRHSLDYVDFNLLRANGIASRIQAFEPLPYRQPSPGFEPNLAILDLLLNCGGPAALDLLRQGNAIRDA